MCSAAEKLELACDEQLLTRLSQLACMHHEQSSWPRVASFDAHSEREQCRVSLPNPTLPTTTHFDFGAKIQEKELGRLTRLPLRIGMVVRRAGALHRVCCSAAVG